MKNKQQPILEPEQDEVQKVRSIEKVLQAEQQAKQDLEDADRDKQKLADLATKRASDIVAQAEQKAQQIKRDQIKNFENELEKRKSHYIQNTERQLSRIRKLKLNSRQQKQLLDTLAQQLLGV